MKLKLKDINNYITEIEQLPEHLQVRFSAKAVKCNRCGCLGNNPDTCANRIYWQLNGTDYIGCSMNSFYFSGIKKEDMLFLFRLLECEYGIRQDGKF